MRPTVMPDHGHDLQCGGHDQGQLGRMPALSGIPGLLSDRCTPASTQLHELTESRSPTS